MLAVTLLMLVGCGEPPRPTSGDELDTVNYFILVHPMTEHYLHRAQIRRARHLDGAMDDLNACVQLMTSGNRDYWVSAAVQREIYEFRSSLHVERREKHEAIADLDSARADYVGLSFPDEVKSLRPYAAGRILSAV